MKGQCLCGTVQFKVLDPTPRLYQCHCSLCRRLTGAANTSTAIVPSAQFQWVAGEDHKREWKRPENGFLAVFCDTCGSVLPKPLMDTPYYWVPAGLLENDPALELKVHVYVGSKAAWEQIQPGGAEFDTEPDPLSIFLELMHPQAAAPAATS